MTEPRWDLSTCVDELRNFSQVRGWGQFHDPKNLSMLLASEAGELLAEFRWIDNSAVAAYVENPEVRSRIEKEIADVMIAVLLLVDRINLDLPSAVLQKIETNRRNYPRNISAGMPHRPER